MLLVSTLFAATGVFAQYASVRERIYELASRGDVAGLKQLASMGYSLEVEDAYGNTPYCQAIWSQNRAAVSALLSAGVNAWPKCLKKMQTVKASTIYSKAHSENLKQLVAWKKEGLNIDVEDEKTGNSALCMAVYRSDCTAVQTLLRAGAKQGQPCMRRIPKSVRDKLDCRPLVIDWSAIGYTTLGIGVAGGLIALLGGHGGNGTPVCNIDERWNGERCISCPTCWVGDYCVTAQEQKANYYYRDETTGVCWTVAPPPRKMDEQQFEEKVSEVESDAAYSDGGFLPSIQASAAYARGYSGYMVNRSSPWGLLSDGQSGPDETLKSVSTTKVKVGIVSSGMTIGKSLSVRDTSGTSQTNLSYWDWSDVNANFYDSASTEPMDVLTSTNESVYRPNVSEVGTTDSSFALNKQGTPYGYNFDYGFCSGKAETWKNCYGPAKDDGSAVDKEETIKINCDTCVMAFYGDTAGTVSKVARLSTRQNGMIIGLVDVATAAADPDNYKIATWNSMYKIAGLNVYEYPSDYTYNKEDPSIHYNTPTSETSSWDRGNEGTFWAGIVAAMQGQGEIYGVAYNSAVLPIVGGIVYNPIADIFQTLSQEGADVTLLSNTLRTTNSTDGSGRNDALGVFNASGTTYTPVAAKDVFGLDMETAMQSAIKKNMVVVVPSGNENNAAGTKYKQPGLYAGIPLTSTYNGSTTWSVGNDLPSLKTDNKLKNLFIVATSVTTNVNSETKSVSVNGLASGAQPCGIAGSYCLSAAGGTTSSGSPIYSTINPVSDSTAIYTNYGGTGAAAAVVAGSVALLLGAYPHLSPQEAVEILYATATYVEASGADVGEDSLGKYNSVYGRGLINLAAATNPVKGKEGMWVPTDSRETSSSAGTASMRVSVAATRMISSAAISPDTSALPSTFMAFDAYRRPFAMPTSMLLSQQKYRKSKSFDDFKLFMNGRDPVKIQPTETFSMLYRNSISSRSNAKLPMGLMEVNLKRNKMTYSLFYSEDTQLGRQEYWRRRLSNPFVQMHNAYGVETAYDLTSKLAVETGWVMGSNGFYDDTDRHFDAPDNKMQAFTTSLVYRPWKPVSFKVSTGVMKEEGSSLGMVSSGAFDIKSANTYFVGAGITFNPIEKLSLDAVYYYGQTRTKVGAGLMNLSHLNSEGFAVALSYRPVQEHVFGLQASSPLRVRSGTLNMTLPVGRHPTEEIYYYDVYKASMKPTAREYDISMYYQGNVTKELSLQSEVGVRLNPDHQADAAPDYRGMLGVKWNY